MVIVGMMSFDAVSASGEVRAPQQRRPQHCNGTTYNQPYSLLRRSCWIPCTETDLWGGKSDVRSLGNASGINSASSYAMYQFGDSCTDGRSCVVVTHERLKHLTGSILVGMAYSFQTKLS